MALLQVCSGCTFSVHPLFFMMNSLDKLRWTIFISMLAATGMACKQVLAPVINVLTDVLLIPGGSTSASISMCFLLVGATLVPLPFTATKMALLQGILALCVGASSFQGLFVLVSYTAPGIVMDLCLRSRCTAHWPEDCRMALAGVLGILAGSFLTNAAFFQLRTVPLLLFLGIGALGGLGSSQLALFLVRRLRPILDTQLISSIQREGSDLS